MAEDLLFLTQRIPYPPMKGEKIRPFNMLRHLSRTYRIHLGCLVDDPDDMQHRDVLKEFCVDAHYAPINPKLAKATCLSGLLTGMPLSYAYFSDSGLKSWCRGVLETVRPQAALVCSSNMSQYLFGNGPRPQTVVCDYADVDSEKWRAYAEQGQGPMRLVYAREHRRVLEQEERIAAASDAISFVSEAEAALFRRMFPRFADKVHGISNGVDSDYFSPEHGFAPVYRHDGPVYVFCGTMDYPPNVEAVQWFATDMLPAIRQRYSDAAFYIVGSRPSNAVQALARLPGVHVTGRVEDVRPYVAHATASVAPMRVARGIQNKVLEAMAMARTVLVSPEGLEGIEACDGQQVIVATDTQAFIATALKAAAGDYGTAIGEAARDLVVGRYSWAAHLGKFDALLRPAPATARTAVAG